MESTHRGRTLAPGWWTLILVLLVVAAIWLTYALFAGTLKDYTVVTLKSDRAGLVMETNAKVKLNGVLVSPAEDGVWDIELPVGLNVIEIGAKGGMTWRAYLDRIAAAY